MNLIERLNKIQLNFIIGIGRSGSTLLVTLLNQNKNCIAVPEIHHFIRFYKKYKNIDKVTEEVINDYKSYLTLFINHKKNPLIGPINYSLIDKLKIGDKINYSQLTKLIYLSIYGDKGINNEINVIVDKNPYYTLQFKKLNEIFPEAKYIALVRDYRGFLLSNIQSAKIGTYKKSTYYYAMAWNLFIKEILKYKYKNPQNIMIVKYEDLVTDKVTVTESIFNFFGISFSTEIFNFHNEINSKLNLLELSDNNYNRMLNKLTNLSNPVNSNRVYEWKNKLTPHQIKSCDVISSKYSSEFGYKIENDFTLFDIIITRLKSVPSYLKIKAFEYLKSPELHFYYKYKKK